MLGEEYRSTVMRSPRFILRLLLAAGVILLPISARAAAAALATKAEMSMVGGGHDCPCCNGAQQPESDFCAVKCFGATAIVVEGLPLIAAMPDSFPIVEETSLGPFSPGPDPRPPRS